MNTRALESKRSRGPYHISVIIPVYNEEGLLETAITDLVAKLKESPLVYEVIVAENGSKDETPRIADDLAKKFRNLRVLHLPEPNYGAALRKGIEEAAGEICICDEIDICDVGFYRNAIDLLTSGEAELVVGSKRHKEAQDKRPLVRRLGTWVINFLLRVLLGFKGTDTHGLKAFKRKRLLPVVESCIVDKDLFASEFVIRAERAGISIVEVPLKVREKRPPSINLFRRVPNVLWNLVRLFRAIRLGKK